MGGFMPMDAGRNGNFGSLPAGTVLTSTELRLTAAWQENVAKLPQMLNRGNEILILYNYINSLLIICNLLVINYLLFFVYSFGPISPVHGNISASPAYCLPSTVHIQKATPREEFWETLPITMTIENETDYKEKPQAECIEKACASDDDSTPVEREIQARFDELRDLSSSEMEALNTQVRKIIDWRMMPCVSVMFLMRYAFVFI